MQAKKYLTPSARSRTHIRRNILNTIEKDDDGDANWLNDVSPDAPVAEIHTQEHTVCYQDLPTMPLSFLSSSLVVDALEQEEEASDEDKTIRFDKPQNRRQKKSLEALYAEETVSLITTLGSQRICIELNIRVRPA